MNPNPPPPESDELRRLRTQVADLSAALAAIRSGDVDALVQGENGSVELYSSSSADRPYRVIVEQMGEGAATFSAEGLILFANRRLAQLIARPEDWLIGRPISVLLPEAQHPDLHRLLSSEETGRTVSAPLNFCRADGSTLPVLVTVSRLDVEASSRYCLIAADLSPIRLAEKALVDSELSFRMLALNSQDGIVLLDWNSGRISLANPAIARLLGRDASSLIGQTLWQIDAFESQPQAEALFRALQSRSSVRCDAMTLKAVDGCLREVEFVSNVYLVGEEQVIQCNIHDISDRKAAERLALQRQSEVLQSLQDMVAALVALSEARDPYTAGHQARVADLAVAIALEMGLDADLAKGIHIAGLVHDIGKFAIPAEILTKPTKLKPAEHALLRTHVQAGYAVLAPIHFPWPVAEAVHHHHERLDGSGYPQGLFGEAISLGGRILAVADTLEAMATHRPYRFCPGLEAALATIEAGRGQLYEPAVVDACLRLFRDKGYSLEAPQPEHRPQLPAGYGSEPDPDPGRHLPPGRLDDAFGATKRSGLQSG